MRPLPQVRTVNVPRILVCDDTPDILEMVQLILQSEGYEVTTASCGREVLESVEAAVPDLVVLDLRMPGLDGLSVLRALTSRSGGGPPVVILSAKGRDEDRREALAVGARGYLVKPFTVGQLLSAVRAQLPGGG
jgi:DNA-binding response OmpR family regulator